MRTNKVDANPTKAFFVRMITRDISLEDCILDLIDNSVDGAWKLEGGHTMSLTDVTDLSKYRIEIQASQDGFSVRDNCGGISFEDAVEYAFSFGRKDDDAPDKYSIGVYGIGMKRAIFKIGEDITIKSTYRTAGDKTESFKVPIDVPKWLGDARRDWDFDIETSNHLPELGVEIAVSKLHEGISPSFHSRS
jgi:Histidine kinase-, DNA gyrase B-, and HSP90-like ATPase